jgi:hypothetical protein
MKINFAKESDALFDRAEPQWHTRKTPRRH